MRRVSLVTNAEKYLLMRAISRDISNMCVQITLVELGSVHIVVKLFNTHATSNVISDHTLVSFPLANVMIYKFQLAVLQSRPQCR